jgi:hypothetical protein
MNTNIYIKMTIKITFLNKKDYLYFMSNEADHWWYLPVMYGAKKNDMNLTIEFNDLFKINILNNKKNKEIMFGYKIDIDKYESFFHNLKIEYI